MCDDYTYYNPTRYESVEIEAELKAGHCRDPDNEIQFCANVLAKSAAEAAIAELFRISESWNWSVRSISCCLNIHAATMFSSDSAEGLELCLLAVCSEWIGDLSGSIQ